MFALLSARRVRDGRIFWTRCTPAAVMFLQKSTCRVFRESAWRATASRVRSVIRTQFSNWSVRRPGQLLRSSTTESSVTWPHPDSFRDSKLGDLKVGARRVRRGWVGFGRLNGKPALQSLPSPGLQINSQAQADTMACKDALDIAKPKVATPDWRGKVKPELRIRSQSTLSTWRAFHAQQEL